jgi:hypothetical protein
MRQLRIAWAVPHGALSDVYNVARVRPELRRRILRALIIAHVGALIEPDIGPKRHADDAAIVIPHLHANRHAFGSAKYPADGRANTCAVARADDHADGVANISANSCAITPNNTADTDTVTAADVETNCVQRQIRHHARRGGVCIIRG